MPDERSMKDAHADARRDHEQWRADIRSWREGNALAREYMERVGAAIDRHDEELDEFTETIENHEAHMARGEEAMDSSSAAEALRDDHGEHMALHARYRSAHERFRREHEAIVEGLRALVDALEA